MIWALVILGILTLYHFLCESVFAPSIRASLRFGVFRCRDEIRALIVRAPDAEERKRLLFLHDSANTTIALIPAIAMSVLYEADRDLAQDERLRRRIHRRIEAISSIESERAREIHTELSRYLWKAYLVNSCGWYIYLVPLALGVSLYRKTSQILRNVIVVPSRDVARLVPCATPAPA